MTVQEQIAALENSLNVPGRISNASLTTAAPPTVTPPAVSSSSTNDDSSGRSPGPAPSPEEPPFDVTLVEDPTLPPNVVIGVTAQAAKEALDVADHSGACSVPACTKHPRYKAIRKPRSGCEACWAMYNAKPQKPTKEVTVPTTLGKDAAAWLASINYPTVVPEIHSGDSYYLNNPRLFYLRRRLGLTPAFAKSDALGMGDWFHRCNEAQGDQQRLDAMFEAECAAIKSLAETLGYSPTDIAKLRLQEQEWFAGGIAMWRGSREYRLPGNQFLENGWGNALSDWKVLARELKIVIPCPDNPKVSRAIIIDELVYHEASHRLRIRDYKTTSYETTERAATCPFEFQSRHYTFTMRDALPLVIKHFNLPADTVLDGMEHWIIRKPTITFGQKDRLFHYVSVGARKKRQGFASRTADGTWEVKVVPMEGAKPDAVGAEAVYGPASGVMTDAEREAAAVKFLHEACGKEPEKEYEGEPRLDLFQQRVVDFYLCHGDFAKNELEWMKAPPVQISFTEASDFGAEAEAEYRSMLSSLCDMATRRPWPILFPSTASDMSKGEDGHGLRDLFVLSVNRWPETFKKHNIIVQRREDQLAPGGTISATAA